MSTMKHNKSRMYDTKSHVSHTSQSYTNVETKPGKEQRHELHDKYVHPVKEPQSNAPQDYKMSLNRESIGRQKDREIEEQEAEIIAKKDARQKQKMPAKP
ncbi:14286_t:CDS:1 [Ambispora leptoticha]|uniref:14286_t:CDS:1 n=1 Tax=Ambispora leptoticha TaxID=144679 RepID=A0A9N9GER9_9GLOM|nr:14286_t:CDS:1 [Ambispora leptoticha]